MGGGREEAIGGGIARRKDGAREQGNETSREVSVVYANTFIPSHGPAPDCQLIWPGLT